MNVLDDEKQVMKCREIYAKHCEGCICEDCRIAKASYDRDFQNKTGVWKDHGRAGY